MNGYRRLGVSTEENNALSDLGKVIEGYRVAMARAETLFGANYSISGIDSQVAADDKPALGALLKLTGAVADLRQAKTEVVSDKIGSLVNAITIAAIGIGLLLLIMILSLTWFLRFRLINPLGKLITAFNQVDLSAPGSIRLPSTGKSGDELVLIANAGQRMFTGIVRDITDRKQADRLRISSSHRLIAGAIVFRDSKSTLPSKVMMLAA